MTGLNVVAYQDGDIWVAQCIDYDIAARAKSLPQLPHALERALADNLGDNAEFGMAKLHRLQPAPERYRVMFNGASIGLAPFSVKAPTPVHVRVAEAA